MVHTTKRKMVLGAAPDAAIGEVQENWHEVHFSPTPRFKPSGNTSRLPEKRKDEGDTSFLTPIDIEPIIDIDLNFRAFQDYIHYNIDLRNLEEKIFALLSSSDLGLTDGVARQLAPRVTQFIEDEKSRLEAGLPLSPREALKDAVEQLPERPIREFNPRKDNIIDYIRAPDGFGPWIEAGELTRPLIRKMSKRAYTALNNWLYINRELPSDLLIPTRSEVIDQKLSVMSPGDLRAAQSIARTAAKRGMSF